MGGVRRPAAHDGLEVALTLLVGHRGEAAHLALGDDRRQPFAGRQQGGGGLRLVAEGRQDLLVGVGGLVRHLHLAPVAARVDVRGTHQQLVEGAPDLGPRRLQPVRLGVLHPHGHRQDPDAPVAVGVLHPAGDGRRALDALVVVGEAVHQHVGEVDGADVGDVAQAGTTVDEDVVVAAPELGAQGVQELAAVLLLVEAVPVELGEDGGVVAVLAARGDVVEPAPAGEVPPQRGDRLADVGLLGDPRLVGRGWVQGLDLEHVVVDEVQHSGPVA